MQVIREDGSKLEFTTLIEDKNNATIFRHFKGHKYRIITIAKDCDNLKDLIIYQNISNELDCWAREKDEFFSLLDKSKYPNINQKYRFEIVD